jgi:hypothetical protein
MKMEDMRVGSEGSGELLAYDDRSFLMIFPAGEVQLEKMGF